MDVVSALSETFDCMHRVSAGVAPGALGRPTPCAEWDVAALMTHAFGVVDALGSVAGGGVPAAFVLDRGAPAAQFRTIADRTMAAWRSSGVMEREMNGGAGPMPGAAYASINLLDTLTHSWDVAKATGQDPAIDEALAAFTLGVCEQLIAPQIRPGRFADPVAVATGASSLDRLVAFLGRTP